MSCCHTTPYYHTGTTTPTNIGPSTGGKLHSISVTTVDLGYTVVRDGGSSGDIIASIVGSSTQAINTQLRWNGLKINGQLNVALNNDSTKVTVEMSD
jgi:hypothetical protein